MVTALQPHPASLLAYRSPGEQSKLLFVRLDNERAFEDVDDLLARMVMTTPAGARCQVADVNYHLLARQAYHTSRRRSPPTTSTI